MSHSAEQPDISLVLADHEQNYYMVPIEIVERGRVPAARKAEIEAALREQEVTGYNPILVGAGFGICVGGLVVSGAMIGAGLTYGGIAAGKALKAYSNEANNSNTPIGNGDTPTVVREQ